ncbi:hypothetical protein PUN28_005428 [Cardiocondyla obscurior]|uniref:Uncharacterized protein n=1 Tax=Cardiocondyla obscurior TaxID=286306 RepID=A0AAW2GHW6_9HYME
MVSSSEGFLYEMAAIMDYNGSRTYPFARKSLGEEESGFQQDIDGNKEFREERMETSLSGIVEAYKGA